MKHRFLQRCIEYLAWFGALAVSSVVLAQLPEPSDADKLSYLVKGKMDQVVWPNHGLIEEKFGRPEGKTAQQIDRDMSLFLLQRAFWEQKFEKNIAEAKKLARSHTYHNNAVLRAIKLYSLAGERNAEMDEVRRMRNEAFLKQEGKFYEGPLALDEPEDKARRAKFDNSVRGGQFAQQQVEIETRFLERKLELIKQPLTGENPNTREIAHIEENFRKEKEYLDEIDKHMAEVRLRKLREEADKEFQVQASAQAIQLQAGQAGSVTITVYGGIPPYHVRATTSENEELADESIPARGGTLPLPLKFPDGGNRSVFVEVEDSGPPGQQKRGGVTLTVHVSAPDGEEGPSPASGQPVAASATAPGTTGTSPDSAASKPFDSCVVPGTYRAYFSPAAWPPGWGIMDPYGLTPEAKLKKEYEFLPDFMDVSVTVQPDGRIFGEARAKIPDEDFEHDQRDYVAKGQEYSWSYSYRFDGTVDFATGKTEIRVTDGRHELFNRNQNQDISKPTTEQRREFRFNAVLRGWMVPGPDDAKRLPEFYAALLGLPDEKSRQELAALSDSTPTDDENQIIDLLSKGAWPRMRRETDGRVVFADCGFIGATVPGDGSAISVKYEAVFNEDIGFGGDFFGAMRKTSGQPASDKEIKDETAEQQQEIDQRAATGRLAWSLRLIGPAPAPAQPAPAMPAEMVAFGIWPPEEPIRITLDGTGKTIQLDAIGLMSGNTVEIKNQNSQGRWKSGSGLASLGQGRFRVEAPGLHRVRVEMKGPDGYLWTATKEILVEEVAPPPVKPEPARP